MVAVNHEDSGGGLHVLVLPKLWKSVVKAPRVHLDATTNRLLIVGYVGQRIALEKTPR